MFQPAPGTVYKEPNIEVKGCQLQAVEKFTYLGCILSRCMYIDDEVNNRIGKLSISFGRVRQTVWDRRGISVTTKLKMYKAVVLTALLYPCETWTLYSRHARKLNHSHTTFIRKVLNIRWTTFRIQKSWKEQIFHLCTLYYRSARIAGHAMSSGCLMTGYQSNYSLVNYQQGKDM